LPAVHRPSSTSIPGNVQQAGVDYLAHLRTVQQAKPSMVNRRLAALRSYARYLQAAGVLRDDPTRDVRGVRQTPRGPRALTPAELRRLLRQAEQRGRQYVIRITYCVLRDA
jgi:site-specific recombinase XerD